MSVAETSVVECPRCSRRNRVPASAGGVPRCASCGAALPWIAQADDASYDTIVTSSKLPVLLDLWAPWCGPCRTVSPVLERLAARYAGRVKLVKVNVDEAPRIQARFEVQGIPTLLVLSGGKVVQRQTGAAPEPVLSQWLEAALAQVP